MWRALGAVADVVVVDASAGVLVGDLHDDLGTGRLVVEVRAPIDPTQPSTVEFTLDQLGALPAPNIDDVVRELARLRACTIASVSGSRRSATVRAEGDGPG